MSLTAEHYRRPHVSQTFHGRGVFAPAAAHLARGVRLEHFGPPVLNPVRLEVPTAREEGGELVGEVIAEDRFGNLIPSLMAEGMARLRGGATVEVEGRRLGPLKACYADGEPGVPAPIIGSQGRLEIFVREGSAKAILGARRGTPVRAGAC